MDPLPLSVPHAPPLPALPRKPHGNNMAFLAAAAVLLVAYTNISLSGEFPTASRPEQRNPQQPTPAGTPAHHP